MPNSNFIWGLAIGAGSVLILLLWLLLGDFGIAWPTELEEHESQSAIVRNYGLLPLGVIGLILAGWRTKTASDQRDIANKQSQTSIDQVRIAQQGQYADRYAKAAAMLSDDKMPVCEAGIFALKELAEADPEGHYFPVQNLLCSFIRNYDRKDDDTKCSSDVIEALRAFSDLRNRENYLIELRKKWKPDLEGVFLCNFPGHLRRINFTNAILDYADLSESDFSGARLKGASLTGTNFAETALIDANFVKVNDAFKMNLKDTILDGANFSGSRLTSNNFTDSYCTDTRFTGARLHRCNFTDARLFTTYITGADFKDAIFTRAMISPPFLPEADWPDGCKPSEVLQTRRRKHQRDYYVFVEVEDLESEKA